jgi:hypothetical protein
LPPDQLSAACVYCGSPHVVNWESEEELLAPDGIIPHAFDQKQAAKLLVDWANVNHIKPEKHVDLPRGVYLPLWSFDLGGVLDYVGEKVDDSQIQFDRKYRKMVRVTDSYPVQVNDLPIPASRKLSSVFMKLIPTFELKAVKPYEAGYIVNWPAEVYDIPMAEASLDARAQSLARYKNELPTLLTPVQLISTSSANMTVESFRLNLLPVWMTELFFDRREHLVLINGMNGVVKSDLPEKKEKPGGLFEWLGDLLED